MLRKPLTKRDKVKSFSGNKRIMKIINLLHVLFMNYVLMCTFLKHVTALTRIIRVSRGLYIFVSAKLHGQVSGGFLLVQTQSLSLPVRWSTVTWRMNGIKMSPPVILWGSLVLAINCCQFLPCVVFNDYKLTKKEKKGWLRILTVHKEHVL